MKKTLLYLLIPIMLVQSNMTLLITVSFYYNQNYIEKYLCIQRDMENNPCKGQCFLAKRIKQQQEQEQQNFKVHVHESFVENRQVEYLITTPTYSFSLNMENGYIPDLYPKEYYTKLDKPPIFV